MPANIKQQLDDLLRNIEIRRYLCKQNVDLLFVFLALLTGIYLQYKIQEIAMLGFIVWNIINPWSSEKLARGTLALLGLIPFALMFKRSQYAEELAIFVYYFLILTVIIAIIEYKREKKNAEYEDAK